MKSRMIKNITCIVILGAVACATTAWLPLVHRETNAMAAGRWTPDIGVYYQGENHPPLAKGSVQTPVVIRNRSANCVALLIDCIARLQDQANNLGANAVINIRVVWGKDSMMGPEGFKCKRAVQTCGALKGIEVHGEAVTLASSETAPPSAKP